MSKIDYKEIEDEIDIEEPIISKHSKHKIESDKLRVPENYKVLK